jgi:hypothetical protein
MLMITTRSISGIGRTGRGAAGNQAPHPVNPSPSKTKMNFTFPIEATEHKSVQSRYEKFQ